MLGTAVGIVYDVTFSLKGRDGCVKICFFDQYVVAVEGRNHKDSNICICDDSCNGCYDTRFVKCEWANKF